MQNKGGESNPYEPPEQPTTEPRLPLKLSLPLAAALVTLVAIAFFFDVVLGTGMLLVTIPAYIRAAGVTAIRTEQGQVPTTAARFLAFLSSVGVVITCAIAGCVAFFCTCTGTFMAAQPFKRTLNIEYVSWAAFALSGIGFVIATISIYRSWWPRRKP